ncbi:MAG: c-type cytochrome [Candidatus Acidiferrum sp.]|jgi:mono/diheme cytochrome c family protein
MPSRLAGVVLLGFSCSFLAAALASPLGSGRPRARPSRAATSGLTLHETRTSALDLEVGGDLAGRPAGFLGYLTRADLLALPQVTFAASDDSNFAAPVQVSGVLLEELSRRLSAEPEGELVVAISDDLYRANYSRAYIAAHHPVLALLINGKEPRDWPKDSGGHGLDMGPFLISHESFTPSFSVLGHPETQQIPWGVVRLEFRHEDAVFGAIKPRGPHAGDAPVQDGYRLAKQNCFRCHNMGTEGGQKAGHPWLVLAAWAAASPDYLAAYVRNPRSKNAHAQMPGNPDYEDATLQALLAYFRTFLVPETR